MISRSQRVSCGYLIIRIDFMFVATFKVKVVTYQRKFISIGERPLLSLLNLPPVLSSDEFQSGIHTCICWDCEPHCRHGQAIMQQTNHLAFATPISFLSGENEMMYSQMMCWHSVTDGSQDDHDRVVLALLNDSFNTAHLIISAENRYCYKVGG